MLNSPATAHTSGHRRRSDVIELTGAMMMRARVSILTLAQQALLLFVLGTVPVLFGAVQAWVWLVYVLAMYAAFVLLVWSERDADGVPTGKGWWVAVGLFLAVTVLACVPLPIGLLAIVSPGRFNVLQQTGTLTGDATAWATVSYAPLQSLAWWAWLLGLALLFGMLSAHFNKPGFLKIALWVLFGVAVLEALYGILQALLPNLGVLWVSYLKSGMGDARGTYINRNHFAGFMEMLLPLLLGFSLSRVRWGGRLKWKALLHSDHLHQHVLMVLGLVVMTLALLFSKSRGGITGALLGMLVFFMFLRGGARQMPKGVWVLCGLFFGLILFYGLRIGFDPIFDRFLALEQGNSRLDYWRDSLPIIAAHPLGIGLAAFETVFPIYDTSTVSDRSMAVYLHNDVLQLLVEAGWIGFSALAGAFTLFMVKMFRRIRCMDAACDPQRFFLAAGAYSGLTAMTVHSFFDFNLQIPANTVYFVMLLAMVKVLSAQSYSQTMDGAERVATGAACGR